MFSSPYKVLFTCFSVLLPKKLKNTHNTRFCWHRFLSTYRVFYINVVFLVAKKMENALIARF